MKVSRRNAIKKTAAGLTSLMIAPQFLRAAEAVKPFGEDYANLETLTTGEWWKRVSTIHL